ncbi:EpsG family protein [Dinghuibacter silviterrae]|uniref:EpsG-like putative glucosyltransferase n=1 Tax=Dinghuibacter silviterrae TaxID=1539049 RepID=A0A4R8DRT2_9BACT|nr:EpsG family protein [Dinghuibacter silviterrae]TDX00067.1 EpsG-like putative glucosyltransferase [Dinghuibacter silviterrae]
MLGLFAFYDLFLKSGKYYFVYICFVVAWLIFHDGFRWGVGTDWEVYHNYFSECLDRTEEGFEPGYVLLSKAIRSITDNYSVFLIVHAIIVYSLVSYTIIKYSVSPLLSYFLFYCIMLTYMGMNREYISFAICVFSFRFILERRIWPFLLCIFVAFWFHLTAIMFVFAYFLNRPISTKVMIWVLGAAVAISLSGILNKLPLNLVLVGGAVGDKLDFYSSSYSLETNMLATFLGLLKRCIWVCLAMFFRKGIKNMDDRFNFVFNLYFIGTVVYVIFNNSILQIVVARGLIYYNIAEIFLVPYLVSIFAKGITQRVFFSLICIYCWLVMQKGMNFYKENLDVDIFRPYNSVLVDDQYDAMDKL